MRKFYLLFVLVVLCLACEKKQPTEPATGIKLNPVTLQLKVGDIANIDVETSGKAADIKWTSSNTDVADV